MSPAWWADATQQKLTVIIIKDHPHPGTPLSIEDAAGGGEGAGWYSMYIELSLSLGAVSKNQH